MVFGWTGNCQIKCHAQSRSSIFLHRARVVRFLDWIADGVASRHFPDIFEFPRRIPSGDKSANTHYSSPIFPLGDVRHDRLRAVDPNSENFPIGKSPMWTGKGPSIHNYIIEPGKYRIHYRHQKSSIPIGIVRVYLPPSPTK